jgi:hypothetical protein
MEWRSIKKMARAAQTAGPVTERRTRGDRPMNDRAQQREQEQEIDD